MQQQPQGPVPVALAAMGLAGVGEHGQHHQVDQNENDEQSRQVEIHYGFFNGAWSVMKLAKSSAGIGWANR